MLSVEKKKKNHILMPLNSISNEYWIFGIHI